MPPLKYFGHTLTEANADLDALWSGKQGTIGVSVKDAAFGAKGDGVTHDAVAINAALGSSAAATVFFPAGNYYLEQALTQPANVSIILAAGASFTGPGAPFVPDRGARFLDLGHSRIPADSVAYGATELVSNTTGSQNVAIGQFAMWRNTTGNGCVAVGFATLEFNTTGIQNTAVGSNALNRTTTGYLNVAFGVSALFSNTTGYDNTAIGGDQPLGANTTGAANVAIGSRSQESNTTGVDNTSVGCECYFGGILTNQITPDFFNTVGTHWVLGAGWADGGGKLSKNADGVGTAAGILGQIDYGVGATMFIQYTVANLTSGGVTASFGGFTDAPRTTNGTFNFAITTTLYPSVLTFTPTTNGSRFDIAATSALARCLDDSVGRENTAVGVGAFYHNTRGNDNVAMGVGALRQHTIGDWNVAIGVQALTRNGSGGSNVALGANALFSTNAGNRCVAVGYFAGYYEMGDDAFYVNNRDQGSTANDKAKSLLYGRFAATAAGQYLRANAQFSLGVVPTYASNAAALAGGLVAGDLYTTGAGNLSLTI